MTLTNSSSNQWLSDGAWIIRAEDQSEPPEVPLQCVLPRSGKVSYPEIEGMKAPELIRWIDDLHNDTIDEMNVERIARKDVTARC